MPAKVVSPPEEPLHDLEAVVGELHRLARGVNEEECAEKRVAIVCGEDAQKGCAAEAIYVGVVPKRNRHLDIAFLL